MKEDAMKVTIVGGGVAALEAMIALRRLAEERADIELVTPTAEFSYRPLAVAEPFGLGKVREFDIVRLAQMHGARMHLAGVRAVRPEEHRIETWDGRTLDYEILLLAIGGNTVPAVPGAVTMQGPGYAGRFRTVLRELEERHVRRVAFAVPAGTSWALPLYELALMTAKRVRDLRLGKVELSLVTPEAEPLELFGPRASAAVRELLEQRGVRLRTGRTPDELSAGELRLVPGGSIAAERVVSLPRLRGPFLTGLPHDRDGFIPVDSHQYVAHQLDVYAAGDATTCPIKQGGVAAQQADAAAESIAARAGAPIDPRPFRPVLRGLLLTGAEPRYMRSDVSGTEETSEISEHSLWWPPGKIAGRYLAPTLALDELDRPPGGMPVHVEIGSGNTPPGGRGRLHVAGR
jgi:sulfide:quinone oxidoreductase